MAEMKGVLSCMDPKSTLQKLDNGETFHAIGGMHHRSDGTKNLFLSAKKTQVRLCFLQVKLILF